MVFILQEMYSEDNQSSIQIKRVLSDISVENYE